MIRAFIFLSISLKLGSIDMNCKRFIILMGSALLMITFGQAFGATQCSSMRNSWTDNFGSAWSINGVKGSIVDEIISGNMTGCNTTYNVTGTLNNGNFSLTATQVNPFGPINISCSAAITYTGTLNKPGCNTATGTWKNNQGISGNIALTSQCVVPSGETTPQAGGWGQDGNYPTSVKFNQSLLPNNYNYGGRALSESFPTDGTDTCWWPGSSILKQTKGVVWPPYVVHSRIPSGYGDQVGMDPIRVKYFRDNNKAPCGYTFIQRMAIDCSSGVPAFKTNTLYLGVEVTTITNARNGVSASLPWDSGPPTMTNSTITTVINVIINYLNSDF